MAAGVNYAGILRPEDALLSSSQSLEQQFLALQQGNNAAGVVHHRNSQFGGDHSPHSSTFPF